MVRPLYPIDWHNATAVTWWLGELVATWNDADAVTRDMLRPARQRKLGHREHERLYREAASKLAERGAFKLPRSDPLPADPGLPTGSPPTAR